jgi:hypothetical protein
MSEIYESMTRAKVGIYVVRVWRDVDYFTMFDEECTVHLATISIPTPDNILATVKALPGASACEIVNAAGMGCVWYKDWP